MADAEANNYPISMIGNQLALPHAKTYSEIDLHEQATTLLEKYATSFDLQNLGTLTDLADIAKNGNQYERGIEFYERGIELAISKNEKKSISDSYFNLGEIYQSIGDLDKALKFFNLDYELLLKLFEANPQSDYLKTKLAISYSKLGDIYQSLGDFEKALEFFNLSKDLFRNIYTANSKSDIMKGNLGISYSKLGGIYQSLGDIDKALQFYNLDLELGKELYEANPKNENIKNNLSVSYCKLGGIYLLICNELEAIQNYNLCKILYADLVKSNPASIIYQRNYAEIIAISAIFELQIQPDNQNALKALKDSVLIWQKLQMQTGREYYAKKIALVEKYQQGIRNYKETIIKLTQE